MKSPVALLTAMVVAVLPQGAHAATLDGAAMSWPFALPFVGLLLTIAAGPLLFATTWHHHHGKIAAFWAAVALGSVGWIAGLSTMLAALSHALIEEYLGFIAVLFALYTVAGGIVLSGDIRGTPQNNAAMLVAGTLIASIIGTTGAAMILIRPLLRANAARQHKTHVVIFFIILVANVGGALSPLGDPPLFVGFLQGVDFLWPAQHLWMQTAIVAGLLLLLFLVVDGWQFRRESAGRPTAASAGRLGIHGLINLPLIAAIIATILLSAAWRPAINVNILGADIAVQNLIRDAALVIVALLSLRLTPDAHRDANDFSWEPIKEVAKLFAAIFTAIIPVLAMLEAGRDGSFSWLLTAVAARDGSPHEAAYFWLAGLMSAFLDNAPTYLLFFKLAGGDAQRLMGEQPGALAAISIGAVYMGALSYIGNAPNFMVYAIATERGVKMPSFFGYVMWAGLILVPLFVLLTLLPIAPLLNLH